MVPVIPLLPVILYTIYMYFKTEGVIISRRNFGEADRILTIYTPDFGKITALARGVRRPRSKKAGHIELANWCKIFIAKGKNLDLLTEVELKRPFGISDFSEVKANRIYHLLELVNTLTAENQKNQNLFHLLTSFLSLIEKDEDFNLISTLFKIKMMSMLGFFSSSSFQNYKSGAVIKTLEEENFQSVKKSLKISPRSHLKLLNFLDSMIEDITEKQLKTSRFLSYG